MPPHYYAPWGNDAKYTTISLSNVINVQPTIRELDQMLRDVDKWLAPGGVIVANYPSTPRYMGLNKRDMRRVLSGRFNIRDTHDGLWLMTRKGE
jgi:hypothetical protein